jgi:hypothetical protein
VELYLVVMVSLVVLEVEQDTVGQLVAELLAKVTAVAATTVAVTLAVAVVVFLKLVAALVTITDGLVELAETEAPRIPHGEQLLATDTTFQELIGLLAVVAVLVKEELTLVRAV